MREDQARKRERHKKTKEIHRRERGGAKTRRKRGRQKEEEMK